MTMIVSKDELASISDETVHNLTKRLPKAELYELGALLISMGCFLTASAIPDLWPRIRDTANLSHELLNQNTMKKKHETLFENT
jgi:hypothetical protein